MMMTGTTGMTGTTCITTGTTSDMTWIMMEMLTGGDGKDGTKEYYLGSMFNVLGFSNIVALITLIETFVFKGHHDQVQG